MSTKTKNGWRGGTLLMLLVAAALLVVGAYNRQGISDWWTLRHYQAPAAVAQLAVVDTMTTYGRQIFYVNKPRLERKAQFKSCNIVEQAAVLGCYHSNQAGIFILQIDDNRLDGIEQVTAAHEMLHAAYDRLSSKQKSKIDNLLEDYYRHGLTDSVVLKQMAGYQKSEPNDVVDEMHSVFGTEVGGLPTALEQYYSRYFVNRHAVTDLYNRYQNEFAGRRTIIDQDDATLANLKTQISAKEADLNDRGPALSAQRVQLDAYKRDGDLGAYNDGVPGYNRLVDAYNSEVDVVQGLIVQYNQLVEQRNSVALEAQQMTDEITSNVKPIGNQ